jgi:hypothetical protein
MTKKAADIRAHQQNLDRYCRLLATDLTDIERQFLHERIAQERLELEQLKAGASPHTTFAFLATLATKKYPNASGSGQTQ